jgi:aminoglycoside phosphotransferase family enzyme
MHPIDQGTTSWMHASAAPIAAPPATADRAADLEADLMRPDAYPAPHPAKVELRETHVSRVFMTPSDVYKVKKAVTFPFLDFGTLDARRRACEAEVLLNSRLATGVYFGLVPVRRDEAGRHHFGPQGEVVDWAVHMLRLSDAFRADERLSVGTLRPEHIDSAASLLADFHARARCDSSTSAWGTITAIAKNVSENFEEVDAAEEGLLTAPQAHEVEDFQLEFLRTRARIFERRAEQGRIREGHGDLKLDHLYVGDDGGLTIIDCIEFSERFRCGDVCADIAFLSMDLAAHGRVDLAERLLARYARAADDFELYALVDFYESYRAYVRGKISTLTARQAKPA